jgi:hypothetical protein
MWFWRDAYFETLKDVAAEASATPEWADYAAYCTQHERGLRRQAFAILDQFIGQMERASFVERKRFVSWLLNRADPRKGSHMLVPQPLLKRVIEPTLAEWLQVEPASSEPHLWLGGYEHLKRAIELDPTDEIARRNFIGCILGHVDYSTHELPSCYLGDPNADEADLNEAEAALSAVNCDDYRRRVAVEIAEQRRSINDYLQRR